MKYQVALDKVSEVSPLLIGEAQEELKRKSEEFMNEVQDSQYIKVGACTFFRGWPLQAT